MTAEIKNLLEKVSVSMLLDSYDAIFSDFDPRPFQERAISDDFMLEARKVLRENEGGTHELHFLIPKLLRNEHSEEVIKERLHKHFKNTLSRLERETRFLIGKGIFLIVLGVTFMFLVSVTPRSLEQKNYFIDFLAVVFEPAGWFMAWYGFDQIFYYSKLKGRKLDFYRKMVKAELRFDTY